MSHIRLPEENYLHVAMLPADTSPCACAQKLPEHGGIHRYIEGGPESLNIDCYNIVYAICYVCIWRYIDVSDLLNRYYLFLNKHSFIYQRIEFDLVDL